MFVDRLLPIAKQRLITITDGAELIEAAKLLRDPGTEIVAVCTPDGALAGVITKTDVVGHISHCRRHGCTIPASSVMTRDVIVCKAGQFLGEVWSTMKKRKLKNIPVVDAELRPIGMLNARDALELLLEEAQDEELLLRDYVMCVGYQ
jgi:CBS domain-containing protein